MIDEGDLDWKVVAISVDDPKADLLNNVADVEKHFPGTLTAIRDWFKDYVEAEIGRLSGTEDGLTVEEYEARLTSVDQAQRFLETTQLHALAVCIGNVHGKYPPSGPNLDLNLLEELHMVASAHKVVLVLHGASGIATELVKACLDRGVWKFNVNTEVRGAYMQALGAGKKDLVDELQSGCCC